MSHHFLSACNVMPHRCKNCTCGCGIASSTLQTFLSNSYAKKGQQAENIDDYVRDPELSGQRASVYHNPKTNHTVVVHKGTQSVQDWGVNALSAIGMADSTKRFKHAEKIQKAAEAKYGRDNVLTTGHSLGAKIAERVGQRSNEVITYNKPVTLENVGLAIAPKQTDIRTSRDPVSLLSGLQGNRGQIQTIPSRTLDPLHEHETTQLGKLKGKRVGR